ncbi:hypothetical protein [Pseudogracilibacillus sp. SO30301A]|uniref:hypothetical protein n=1 Tax=Pseudogracilibacillus sp. SO30301A TaxID=3098291 RepID=UPI00300DFFF2
MSSHEILINPDQFTAEVDEFKGKIEGIASVKSEDVINVNEKSILDSMYQMIAIINTFQSIIDQYIALANKDVTEMNSLKEKWVTKDTNLSNEINGN